MTDRHPNRKRWPRPIAVVLTCVLLFAQAGCSKIPRCSQGRRRLSAHTARADYDYRGHRAEPLSECIHQPDLGCIGPERRRKFEERMIDQIQQFFKELGTMNLLAQEHGVELTSQEKDSIKRLTEQYSGLLTGKADREYIRATRRGDL